MDRALPAPRDGIAQPRERHRRARRRRARLEASRPPNRNGCGGVIPGMSRPTRTTCKAGRCSSAIRPRRRSARLRRSSPRLRAIRRTRWRARAWRWRAPTCACGSRGRLTSIAGDSAPRRRRGPRSSSTATSPRLTWRAPRSRASASSTGTRSSSRAGARWCSIRTSIRPTSSSLRCTTHLATWKRRGSRWRAARDCRVPTRSSRSGTQGLIALWSGHFAPARVHFEEVSRLSDQAIARHLPGAGLLLFRAASIRAGPCSERWPPHRPHRRPRAPASRSRPSWPKVHPTEARAHLERVAGRGYRDHHVAYNFGTALRATRRTGRGHPLVENGG